MSECILKMPDTDLIRNAWLLASAAHEAAGQRRNYTFEPYIFHPARVANTIAAHDYPDHVIAAAIVHDVVEDTTVSLADLNAQLGSAVADLVYWVTNLATKADGDRAARSAINRRHVQGGPPDAQTIKAADILDNVPSIIRFDRPFAEVYIPEKIAVLDGLDGANRIIRAEAQAACARLYGGHEPEFG